ncbi:unnamed protein product [Oikopleura dioica]|uniref:Uncharacterized protein n=1 Tax=Oikopleura dioica TaxID=34765 RepID=E4XL95_OIKDI|nr:unnamed protein product [Oikopleura dioica]
MHNCEVTGKWTAAEHLRAQNNYVRGLEPNRHRAWYFKKSDGDPDITLKERIQTLTDSGHPTLFESKLAAYYGLINKTIRIGKAHDLNEELMHATWIVDGKYGHQIISLFNLYHTDRELARERYFLREFNISSRTQTKEFRIAHHISNIFKVLLYRNCITLKIIQPKNISSEASKIMWPYSLSNDFNELPNYIRASVIRKDQKAVIKGFLQGNHKHFIQALGCDQCYDGKRKVLPYSVKNLKKNILDSESRAKVKDEG